MSCHTTQTMIAWPHSKCVASCIIWIKFASKWTLDIKIWKLRSYIALPDVHQCCINYGHLSLNSRIGDPKQNWQS